MKRIGTFLLCHTVGVFIFFALINAFAPIKTVIWINDRVASTFFGSIPIVILIQYFRGRISKRGNPQLRIIRGGN